MLFSNKVPHLYKITLKAIISVSPFNFREKWSKNKDRLLSKRASS